MAVTTIGSPNIFLNNSVPDPRYPLGQWTATINGTGDGSGGNMDLIVRFRASTDGPLRLGFSLVEIMALRYDTIAENVKVYVSSFSPGGVDGTVFSRDANLVTSLGAGNYASEIWPRDEMFLGSPVNGLNCQIGVRWLSNTNGISYSLNATGQIWLYDGMLDIGGAQLPSSTVTIMSGPSSPSGGIQAVRAGRETVQVPVSTPVGPVVVTAPPVQIPAAVQRIQRLSTNTQATIRKVQEQQRQRTAALATAAAAAPARLASGRTLAAAQAEQKGASRARSISRASAARTASIAKGAAAARASIRSGGLSAVTRAGSGRASPSTSSSTHPFDDEGY